MATKSLNPVSEREGDLTLQTAANPNQLCGFYYDTDVKKWSGRRDLNPGPLAPQASALARLRHGPKYLV